MTTNNSAAASARRMIDAIYEVRASFTNAELARMSAADLVLRMAIVAVERSSAAIEGSA